MYDFLVSERASLFIAVFTIQLHANVHNKIIYLQSKKRDDHV
jgi:hypothetical protein